jgi:hypothetical protein
MGAIVGGTMKRFLGAALLGAALSSGCVSLREIVGLPAESTPTVSLRAEPRWVLVKNPRFGDFPSEPQYIWVEEDKIPWSFQRVVSGKRSVLAPPDVVARYGRPPGGGKISPVQAGLSAADQPPSPGSPRVEPAPAEATQPTRGFVVFVDTHRVVIDLTVQDGIQPGSVVSLRRSRAPIVHPITGELLGELDMEVARGKVLEVREQFSVVELQSVTPGAQVKVKDRAIPR